MSNEWNDWSANSQKEIDAMIDAYKQDESSTGRSANGHGRNEPGRRGSVYDDMSASDTDESGADDEDHTSHPTSAYSQYQPPPAGMATCEFCGRVGVRHAFYSKSKRFCTLACSRSYSASMKDKMTKNVHHKLKKTKRGKIPGANSAEGELFDWGECLNDAAVTSAQVSSFKHVPMADSWENINVGMKIEVLNTDNDLPYDVYWVATVIRLAGYKAQVRYEGFTNEVTHDFWINLCIQDVHPVGWCATMGKSLVPPKTIQHKYVDWKDFLVKRLTGARTLPQNFYNKVQENIHDHPITKSVKVEVVDKMCVSAMRVATVQETIGGRLHLIYDQNKPTDTQEDFWCHRESPLVHPVGWSQSCGHKLHASSDYRSQSHQKFLNDKYEENDSSPDMFPKPDEMPLAPRGMTFQAGMKLEAIDPLNLSCICVATVQKVLKNNYLMIGIDGSTAEDGSDWFCYHATSPCIFPVGFCEINNIDLTPPRGFRGKFEWGHYLKQTRSTAAPVKLFQKDIPKLGMKAGMKLEAVDLMEPRLICVATIVRIVGRLLRIHFDGWEDSYDQWIDCESPDIYPVGWCEMTGYHLEGPKLRDTANTEKPLLVQRKGLLPANNSLLAQAPATHSATKKRRSKNQVYRGPRKKRKAKTSSPVASGGGMIPHLLSKAPKMQSQSSVDTDDMSVDSSSAHETDQPDQREPHKLFPQTSSDNTPRGEHDKTGTTPSKDSVKPVGMGSPPRPMSSSTPTHSSARSSSTPSAPGSSSISLKSSSSGSTSSVAASSPVLAAHIQQKSGSHSTSITTSPLVGTLPQKTSPLPSIATVLNFSGGGQTRVAPSPAATTSAIISSPPPSGGVRKTPDGLPAISPNPFSMHMMNHNIPRVISGEPDKECGIIPCSKDAVITPDSWSVFDVCQFLRINDCGAYCDSFSKKTINGTKFMTLTKEQIVNLTGMKVGPSLKIYDLIQQLKISVANQRQRPMPKGTTTVVTIGSPQRAQVVQQVVTPGQTMQATTLKAQLKSNANSSIPFIAQNS